MWEPSKIMTLIGSVTQDSVLGQFVTSMFETRLLLVSLSSEVSLESH